MSFDTFASLRLPVGLHSLLKFLASGEPTIPILWELNVAQPKPFVMFELKQH
jgi:hypothetical protein